ncbi:hypothetical protein I316_04294 [Kwoniella heveanensis BCC8398]|uniref:Steroid 5-alpha reductase C-terminal domain-containing protein n=1 Tax=Kwoniella heveanensis BCC8398 TaxID=1296120 RepID=A0A1B9GSK6_9TREE|nr:hypothetical protein I316_04294 [Kwoniella heveanensis BCC8398]
MVVHSTYLDVGVLRDTLLPNLGVQAALALPVYLIGRSQNYYEAKDWLWGGGQVASAWWAAIGRHIASGVPLSAVVKSISKPGWLLLTGVTAWGGHLLYRVASRAIKRGHDDHRYDEAKKDPSGWNKAFFSLFGLEALVQAVITLPFTVPFRLTAPAPVPPAKLKDLIHGFAIAVFTAGLTLEVLADAQLGTHQEENKPGLLKEGVWSIVRHPNYLGDILIHSSWPILLYANGLFNPLVLLGPIANWFFLRNVSGDKENEASQAERYQRTDPQKKAEFDQYRQEKNSVWPAVSELGNKWTWIVLGAGAVGAAAERLISSLF